MVTPGAMTVGEPLWYFSRARVVAAAERGGRLEPLAAVAARIHYGKDNERTGAVSLVVFDPEAETGTRVVRDVPCSDRPTADHYMLAPTGRVRMPVEFLKGLIAAGIDEALAQEEMPASE